MQIPSKWRRLRLAFAALGTVAVVIAGAALIFRDSTGEAASPAVEEIADKVALVKHDWATRGLSPENLARRLDEILALLDATQAANKGPAPKDGVLMPDPDAVELMPPQSDPDATGRSLEKRYDRTFSTHKSVPVPPAGAAQRGASAREYLATLKSGIQQARSLPEPALSEAISRLPDWPSRQD